ncbi:MAG: hypothetical protein WCQ70_05720 [Lentimicrobiaceae bacterium]
MTSFNSEPVSIKRNSHLVFDFLADFHNFEKLMPSQVTDWRSDGDSCSFNIQNMATLAMRYEQKVPFSHIKIISEGKSPFSFDLQCFIEPSTVESCIVNLQLNASLNPMLKMMVSKPLSNFINILAHKLQEVCETTLPESGVNDVL